MESGWIAPRDLEQRIDAAFYGAPFVENQRRIEASAQCERLDDLRQPKRPITNGIRGPEFGDTANRMLRLQDIDMLWFDSAAALRVSDAQFQQNRRAHCLPGDILLAIGGYIGIVGKVVDSAPQTMGQHSALLAFDPGKVDRDYALVFFSSHPGTMLCQRYVSGGVQAGINLEDVREIRIPVPHQDIQRAIGNKVRKAERLRELAAYWTQVAHAKMDNQSIEFDKDPAQSNWIALADLNSRLDTQPYRTHFLSLHKALLSSSAAPLSKLAVVSGGDPVSSDEFDGQGVPLVRIRDIQPTGFAAPDVHVPESYFCAKPQCAARPGRIVMGMDGEFRAQFFIESDLPRFINQRVAIVDCKTIRPELLVAWLNRAEGQLQLARWAVQTTVAHTSLSDIRELLIPRLADDEEEWLADAFLRARKADAEAVLLINTARAAVESLIDGTLDKAALLAAGEAIEQWLAENRSPHLQGA